VVVDAGVPDALVQRCLDGDARTNECSADVAMRVVDFTTGAPVPAEVSLSTAWDTVPPFPVTCPPLATVTAAADGTVATLAPCDSVLRDPVLLVLVTGGDRAPTGWDQKLDCGAGPVCGSARGDLAVPSAALAAEWRAELAAGGMPGAATRGLVLFLFRERDDSPAAGVRAVTGTLAPVTLAPGIEVRYVAADRRALLPAATETTGESGLAVIAVDEIVGTVGGRRGEERWVEQGVLVADGWFFLEDRTRAP
jgi:hypothetical protein